MNALDEELCKMPRFLVDAAAPNPSPGRTLLLAPSSSKVQRLLLPLPVRPLHNARRPPRCGRSCPLSPWRPLHNLLGPRICGRSYSLSLWERVGVRVFRATIPGLRNGLSVGEGQREGLPVASTQSQHRARPRADSPVRRSSPLQGERQIPPSPAVIGEGSSGRDPTRQQPRADSRVERAIRSFPLPVETFAQPPWSSNLRPLLLPLPLGEGWGEGLPGNHPGVTQRSPVGDGWSLPRTRSGGEGLPGTHPKHHLSRWPHPPLPGSSKAWRLFPPLPVGEGRGEGLPGTHPNHHLSHRPHPPLTSLP